MDPVFGDVDFFQRIERFLRRHPENPPREEPRGTESIPLTPDLDFRVTLRAALEGRKSVRTFAPIPIGLRALSTVLHFSYGPCASDGRRAVPSAGHFYALDLVVFALRCADLPAGVYLYSPTHGTLEKRADRPTDQTLTEIIPGFASFGAPAAFVAIFTQVGAVQQKYGARAARFLLVESGAILQNASLIAAGTGLGLCAFGGGYDVLIERESRSEPDALFLGGFLLGGPADGT